jgi:acyl carrier protein
MGMQKTNSLSQRVQTLLSEALGVPPAEITPEMTFGDLPQWDSMGHMEVMMFLEEHFGVEISAETIAQLTSIPAICAYIQENGHAEG